MVTVISYSRQTELRCVELSGQHGPEDEKEQNGQYRTGRYRYNPGNKDSPDYAEIDRLDTTSHAYAEYCANQSMRCRYRYSGS